MTKINIFIIENIRGYFYSRIFLFANKNIRYIYNG